MTDASVLVRALERCREFAESERKNTQMLMSNPPQSSAAWNIRNFIKDEIKALATYQSSPSASAVREECAGTGAEKEIHSSDGEGPGPSTLAATPYASPSASRRGEPSPESPPPDVKGLPDYIYDPDHWEYTMSWKDRELLLEDIDLHYNDTPKRFDTLINGPPQFVVRLVLAWDESGDPDEMEYRWFDTEEAASAAVAESDALSRLSGDQKS